MWEQPTVTHNQGKLNTGLPHIMYKVSRSPKVGLPISGNLGVRMSLVKSRVKYA